jgi:hypothetical protein
MIFPLHEQSLFLTGHLLPDRKRVLLFLRLLHVDGRKSFR